MRRVMAGLLLLLTLAACGDEADDGTGVATAGGTPSASTSARKPKVDQETFLKYAQCMREQGIPMEDPQLDGGAVRMMLPEGTDKAKVEAAQRVCKQHMPNGGEPMQADPQLQEQMRKLAQCMRENGVPNFPDPGPDGGIQIRPENGVDPRSEAFKQAQQQCEALSPRPGGDGGPKTDVRGDGR